MVDLGKKGRKKTPKFHEVYLEHLYDIWNYNLRKPLLNFDHFQFTSRSVNNERASNMETNA